MSEETPREHLQAAIKLCEEDFGRLDEALTDDNGHGICLECLKDAEDYVEPDAERYLCPHCGERAVYGVEEIVMMGAPA